MLQRRVRLSLGCWGLDWCGFLHAPCHSSPCMRWLLGCGRLYFVQALAIPTVVQNYIILAALVTTKKRKERMNQNFHSKVKQGFVATYSFISRLPSFFLFFFPVSSNNLLYFTALLLINCICFIFARVESFVELMNFSIILKLPKIHTWIQTLYLLLLWDSLNYYHWMTWRKNVSIAFSRGGGGYHYFFTIFSAE